jgi:hypothetical protein
LNVVLFLPQDFKSDPTGPDLCLRRVCSSNSHSIPFIQRELLLFVRKIGFLPDKHFASSLTAIAHNQERVLTLAKAAILHTPLW